MARTVAVKILSTAGLTDEETRRFRYECQAMGALGAHPNIVSVFDAGSTDSGHPYLVMEFVPAGSLAPGGVIAHLGVTDVLDLGVQIAGALATAHQSGVLHRDVKPANILLGPAGNYLLTDFGIAAVQGGTHTQTGMMVGTVAHLAPEVINGERATARSDVYGLGTTLHALLTGQTPFGRTTDETPAASMRRILDGESVDLRALGVPDVVADVIGHAMATDPQLRYQSAQAFGQALIGAQVALGQNPTRLTVLDLGPVLPEATNASPSEAETMVRRTPVGPAGVGTAPKTVGPTEIRHDSTPTTIAPSPLASRTERRSPLVWLTAVFALLLVAAVAAFVLANGGDNLTTGEAASDTVVPTAAPAAPTTLAFVPSLTSPPDVSTAVTLAETPPVTSPASVAVTVPVTAAPTTQPTTVATAPPAPTEPTAMQIARQYSEALAAKDWNTVRYLVGSTQDDDFWNSNYRYLDQHEIMFWEVRGRSGNDVDLRVLILANESIPDSNRTSWYCFHWRVDETIPDVDSVDVVTIDRYPGLSTDFAAVPQSYVSACQSASLN